MGILARRLGWLLCGGSILLSMAPMGSAGQGSAGQGSAGQGSAGQGAAGQGAVAQGAEFSIETFAGSGQTGAFEAGELALETPIDMPFGVEFGPDQALYVTSVGQHRVLRVDPVTSRVTCVAGHGEKGYTGDGQVATLAHLNEPYEVRFGPQGHMIFVEMENHVVRRVDAVSRRISTIAGVGTAGDGGDGGPAIMAQLDHPHSVAIDDQGAVYIADIGNHRVRRVDPQTGKIESIVGDGQAALPRDGEIAKGQPIWGPRALHILDRTLWIALREGHSVWRLDLDSGRIHHVAGDGNQGFAGDGGPAKAARFDGPKGVFATRQGKVYVMDTENQAVREIDLATNLIRTVAGHGPQGIGFGGDGGPAPAAQFDRPHGICFHEKWGIFVGDTNNHRVRRVFLPAPR